MIDRLPGLGFRAGGVLVLIAAMLPAVLFLSWPTAARAQEPPNNPAVIRTFAKVDPNPASHPQPADQVDGEFEVKVSFNVAVTGFTADDFEVDHGSATDLQGPANGVYTVTFTVDEGYEGPLTVTLPENAVDEGNAERSLSFTVDQTDPTVSLSIPSYFRRPITGWFSTYLTFSEAVKLGDDSDTGALAGIRLQKSDLTVTSGSVISLTKVSDDETGRRYRAYISPGAYQGDYTITLPEGMVQDAVGNPNEAATITVAVDGVSPTVEITGPESGYVKKGGSFDVKFQFSEEVTGFAESDITVTGGTLTASSLTSAGDNAWTASITVSGTAREVVVTVSSFAVRDAARRANGTTKATIRTADPPGVVRDILEEYSRDKELGISWIGPESDGGAPIVEYQYRYGPVTGDDVEYSVWKSTGFETGGAAKRHVYLAGLTNGTEYSIQMRARNGAAAGPYVTVTGRPNPRVTIRTSTREITEGESATFTLTRAGDTANSLTVDVCDKVLADGVCDVRTTTVTFDAGSETATYTATTVDNDIDDPNRNLLVAIVAQDAAPYTYNLGHPDDAQVKVKDNDDAIVVINRGPATAVEEGDPAIFVLGRDGVLSTRLKVKVSVTQVGDFLTDNPPTWVTFLPGQQTTTFSVPTRDDDLPEDDGTVTVTIATGSEWRVGNPSSASRTITSDDLWQQVTIAPKPDYNVVEGKDAIFILTRKVLNTDGTTDDDVSGRGALTGTVALSEEVPDAGPPWNTPRYTSGDERTVTFAAGASTATLRVATAENRYDQRAHKLTATPEDGVQHRTPAAGEAGDSAKVEIADDDNIPRVSISAPKEVNEGEDAVFTLTRTGDTTVGLRAYAVVIGTTRMLSPETSRRLSSSTSELGVSFGRFRVRERAKAGDFNVDFEPGSSTATLTFGTQTDETAEGDGIIRFRGLTHKRYYFSTSHIAEIKVKDNDTAVLTLELVDPPEAVPGRPNTYRIEEGAELTWRVTRTGGTDHDFFYGYETDRTSGHDRYNDSTGWRPSWGETSRSFGDNDIVDLARSGAIADRLWSIPAGNTRTTVKTRAHWVTPSEGELHVRLRDPYPGCNRCPQYTLGDKTEFRLLITNRTPGISITAGEDSIEEGGSVTFTLARTWNEENTRHIATEVDLAYNDPDGVISGTPPKIVTIPKGRTSATFTITTTDDDEDGPDRSFTVAVAAPEDPREETFEGEFEALAPFLATVTVTDNDDPPLPTVTIAEERRRTWRSEAAGTIDFVVTRTGGGGELVVYLDVAREGDFFPANSTPPSSVTIAAESDEQTFSVPLEDDDVPETAGSVTASIEARDTYVLGDPSSAMVAVIDDESFFIIRDVSVDEDDGNVDVTVTFVGNSVKGSEASVDWATADGTAEAGSDYTASSGSIEVAAGTCKLPPGIPTCSYTVTIPITDDGADEADETFRIVLSGASGASAMPFGTVTITDDDDPTVVASIESLPESDVVESAKHMEFLIKLSAPSQNTVEVDWKTRTTASTGAATPGRDYFAANGTAVFARGETEQRVRVTILDDDIDEEYPAIHRRHSESLLLDLTAARNAILPEREGGVFKLGWIRDDDVRGVTAAPVTLSIPEDGMDTYTLVLDTEPTADVTVTVTVPSGSDLSASPSSLTFTDQNWDQPQTVTVSAAADADDVADAPVTITHSASGGDYGPAPTDSVTVTITGDAGAALSVADAGAVESEGEIVFTVAMGGSPTSQVTVNYATSNGTAEAGSDYTSTSGTLTFPAGGAATRTVTVPVTDDDDSESAETFTLTLTGAVNAVLAVASATGTITDDDSGFSVTGGRVSETGGEIVFTVTRQGSNRSSAFVSYDTEDVTALAGSDYTAGRGRLTFLSGARSKTVSVPIINDLLDEADEETFTLTLSRPHGAVIAPGKGSAEGVIVDDDRAPKISFKARYQSVDEDAGPLEFTVKLSAASGLRVEVDYATRELPGEADAGSDFVAVDGTLVFEPGETEQTITVELVDDDVAEAEEHIRLELSAAVNSVISVREATGNIRDDDLYNVTVAARQETAAEGGVLIFDLERDGDTSRELIVTLGRTTNIKDDENIDDEDDVTVTFKGRNVYNGTPGQSRVTYRWRTEVNPAFAEGLNRVFTVTVKTDSRDPAQYRPGTPSSASTVVKVGDALLVLSYEKMDPLWAAAGDKVSVKWTVLNLAGADAEKVKVKTDRTEGTHDCADTLPGSSESNDGEDVYTSCTVTATYAATAADVTAKKLTINASVTKTAGEASNSVTVVFPQGAEHILSVSNPAGPADEYGNTTHMFFPVYLNAQSTETVTVAYATSDGTATANTDGQTRCRNLGNLYVTGFDYIPKSGTLTFEPGDTQKIVSVGVCDDKLLEADETIVLTLSGPTGADLDSDRSSAVGTIRDDDEPVSNPKITISRDSAEVAEDAGYAEIVISLSAGTNDTVTVDWTTRDLAAEDERPRAMAGMDYTAASGTVTFAPRVTEQTIRVSILDDMMDERDLEHLEIALSNANNGMIEQPGTFALAIKDNDERGVAVDPGTLSIQEGDSRTYAVTLTSQPTEEEGVTVAVGVTRTVGGTENIGVSAAPRSLTFTQDNWRDAQVVTVAARIDDDDDNDVFIELTHTPNGSDYDGETGSVVYVTVIDRPVVVVADKTVAEDAGEITVEVTLNRARSSETTVDWTAVDGTAKAGSDYTGTPLSGTLTFAANDTSENITLTITDDSLDELNKETFTIALSNPSGNVGTGPDATVTITDNDNPPTVTLTEVSRGSEASGVARLRWELSSPSGLQARVKWVTAQYGGPNAATPGEDFISATGTVTFDPGEDRKDITVVIVDDGVVEPEERFVVDMVQAVGTSFGNWFEGDFHFPIVDNDEAGVEVRPTAVNVPEGGTGEYTLRLTSQQSDDVTITVTVPADTDLTAGATTYTFTSDNWDQSQTVTLTAAEDADITDDEVSVTHAASGGGYDSVSVDGVDVTIQENDFPTLTIADSDALEDSGGIEFTVTLSQASDKDVSASWSTTDDTATGGTDYVAVTAGSLTIPAGDTEQTITVRVLADGSVEPDETFTVTLADPVKATLADATATGTINDDDELAVTVEPTTLEIGEGGSAVYRVSIGSQPTGGDVTIEVTVPSGTDVSAGPTTLTFTAGNWRYPQYVVVNTADDDDAVADAPVTLTHAVSGGGYGSVEADSVTVTITEENERAVDVTPTALILDEGEAGSYQVVLRSQPTADVTVTVTVPSDAGATADKASLTFTTDDWDVEQTVKVTATTDDDTNSPPTFSIAHAVSGGDYGSETADSVAVTVKDNTVAALTSEDETVAESAGSIDFEVSLDVEAGETVTVSYATSDVTATAGQDYTRTSGTLTFSASETTKTVSVPVLADEVDEGDEEFTLTFSNIVNAGFEGGESSLSVTGTIEDDDVRGLLLNPASLSIREGGRDTYTVALESQPSADVYVAIQVPAGAEVSVNTRKLAFTPANWNVPQSVMVNAYQDRDAQPDPTVEIEHTASGGDYGEEVRGPGTPPVSASMDVTVTEDDEPTVTLSLDSDTISENGGVATVTATLSEQSTVETTITVSIDPTTTSSLSSNVTLTIAAGQTESTGVVKVTATDDDTYTGNREVRVSGSAVNSAGLEDPEDVTLTITDDEAKPVVTLTLTPDTISEDEGVATVTAGLDEASGAATTVTVSIAPTTTSNLSSNVTLTIPKGETESTGEVTITAVNGDSVYAVDRTVTVSGAASNSVGVDGPEDVTLTITDDDDKPRVTLVLTPTSVSEDGGTSVVTASLNKASSAETTIVVSLGSGPASLSTDKTLTIAASSTTSSGTVTVTGTDDSAYTGSREVTVSGAASNSVGVDGPEDVVLTVTDDESAPVVTLRLTPASISEDGGRSVVTASLDKASSAETTIVVSLGSGPATLSTQKTLTIAASSTTSSGTVTITGTDDSAYTGSREVTVSGAASNSVGVDGPEDVTLTVTDDESAPVVTLTLTPTSVSENGGTSTVTASLDKASSAETTIVVSLGSGPATLSTDKTLTIAANATDSSGTVTITGTDDSAYTGDRTVTVSGAASNSVGVDGPEDVTLTVTDDDDPPVLLARTGKVTLVLDHTTISEDGGTATVTATLPASSNADTTIVVSVDPTETTTLSSNKVLTITAGNTSSSGVVTITAVNDGVYTGTRTVNVKGDATNSAGIDDPDDVVLTITEDDNRPGPRVTTPKVTLKLDSTTISEDGGSATVTATLSAMSTADTTITVWVHPTTTTTLTANKTLTITAGQTTSKGVVIITANNDSVYTGNRTVRVSGSASNTAGVDDPDDVTLTITDDDGPGSMIYNRECGPLGDDAAAKAERARIFKHDRNDHRHALPHSDLPEEEHHYHGPMEHTRRGMVHGHNSFSGQIYVIGPWHCGEDGKVHGVDYAGKNWQHAIPTGVVIEDCYIDGTARRVWRGQKRGGATCE